MLVVGAHLISLALLLPASTDRRRSTSLAGTGIRAMRAMGMRCFEHRTGDAGRRGAGGGIEGDASTRLPAIGRSSHGVARHCINLGDWASLA